MFCKECGNQISDNAAICMKCGVATGIAKQETASTQTQPSVKRRLTYILLAIFLGGLGVHNFYAGYSGKGIAQLLISLLTGWLIVPLLAVGIWVIVEMFTVTQDSEGRRFS